MSASSRLAISATIMLALSGCMQADEAGIEAALAEIRTHTVTRPLPTLSDRPRVEVATYRGSDQRSPFAREIVPVAVSDPAASLETSLWHGDTELAALRLVGTLQMGARRRALVASPAGEVAAVSEGDYLGRELGRVERVEAAALTFSERHFAPAEGWQQRRTTMAMATP